MFGAAGVGCGCGAGIAIVVVIILLLICNGNRILDNISFKSFEKSYC